MCLAVSKIKNERTVGLNHKGFGLVILIALIAIFGIISIGTSVVLTNGINQMQLRIDKVKAHYLAQAGAMRAIHNWLSSNAGEANRRYAELNTTVTGNQLFKTGCQANFAYFQFGSAAWASANTVLRAWQITNIHSANAITLKSVKVNWVPAAVGVNLTQIRLNNVSVASGSFANGSVISLASTSLASGSNWSGNNTNFTWSANPMSGASITIRAQWTFNDDSATKDSVTHNVLFWNGAQSNAGRPATRTFCVTSTGQVAQSTGKEGFPILETVKATCSGSAGAATNVEITDWQELDKNIP